MRCTIEILLITIPLVLLTPLISNRAKKLWSITLYSVLAGCLLICMLGGLRFNAILNITKFLYSDKDFLIFGFPIIFVLDNLTCIFCLLTVLLAVVCLLTIWGAPNYMNSTFFLLVWVMAASLFHTFSSLNLLTFFVFFEISLVPMVLFILIWGSRQRKVHAMYVFFFYTVGGSIFLLAGLLYLYFYTNTLFFPNLTYVRLPDSFQFLLWVFFFVGFGVKVPVVPLHTWLPEAHVEAPTIGSIILAGLLLKIGTFGMLRFMFPFLNETTFSFQPVIFTVSIVSVYHASLVAMRQFDLKKTIAYSSVAHMGFVVSGLFSLNTFGFFGAIFTMFSHGLVASALFFSIGIVYDRYKSRNVLDYGGIAQTMPLFSLFFFLLIISNLSFPGTSNFIGEFLTLAGLTEVNYFVSFLATSSIVFTSIYSIWLFNRLIFGSLEERLVGFSDLTKTEFYTSFVLVSLAIVLGMSPTLLLGGMDSSPLFYLLSK